MQGTPHGFIAVCGPEESKRIQISAPARTGLKFILLCLTPAGGPAPTFFAWPCSHWQVADGNLPPPGTEPCCVVARAIYERSAKHFASTLVNCFQTWSASPAGPCTSPCKRFSLIAVSELRWHEETRESILVLRGHYWKPVAMTALSEK